MKSITKIVIKSTSGYVPPDGEYEDKVTITSSSISYRYCTGSSYDVKTVKEWRYKTNSEAFKREFEEISKMVLPVLEKADKEGDCLDIGGTAFKITFSDKSKLEKDYWIPRKSFKKLFVQIKKLLPRVESVPVVLGGSEDNENE